MTAPTLREAPGATEHVLEVPGWRERFGVVAGVTTREAGDLGLLGNDPAREVMDRWRGFLRTWDPAFRTVATGLQVHGTEIAIHDGPPPGWLIRDGVDGHLTMDAGVLLTVTIADCVPIYLVHPPTGALALLHAGWRGIASGMVEAGIRALTSRSGGQANEIVSHCGVSICRDCYEVGSEVIAAVAGRSVSEPEGLDLRAEIGKRLSTSGIVEFSTSPWCSAHHQDGFFSHRRSGGADGRMIAFLGRPGPARR